MARTHVRAVRAGPHNKGVPGKKKLQSAAGRQSWGKRRALMHLTGPGWCIDELLDGTYSLRRPYEAKGPSVERTFFTTLYQRPGR